MSNTKKTLNSIPTYKTQKTNQLSNTLGATELSHTLQFTPERIIIHGYGSVNITHIKKALPYDHWQGFKNTVISLSHAGKLSGNTIIRSMRGVSNFLEHTPTQEITVESISYYYEHCRTKGLQFTHLKNFLANWHHLGFEGISDEVMALLGTLSNTKKPRPSGSRIRSDNLEEGWYSDEEYENVVASIWADYESEKNDIFNTTACILTAQYGRRPIQIAHLKIGDLKEIGQSCGVSGRRIEFPGAKEKFSSGFRTGKIEVHPMGEALWELCQIQAKKSRKLFEKYLGKTLTPREAEDLPLFPAKKISTMAKKIWLAENQSSTNNFLASQFLHVTGQYMSRIISRWRDGTRVISHRTGKPLIENAYRLRYTRARQLARMGVPRATLQYWLGHEGTTSIEAYYDDPAERARILNDSIAPLMAPLAQAFRGVLRDKESDAIRGNSPTSRIELDGRDDLSVGTCGEHGFCSASVPIPCYRCTKFQPWVYAPHSEVLERLLERQRLENELPRAGGGKRLLLPLQLDKDISAVRMVIELCDRRKKELGQCDE